MGHMSVSRTCHTGGRTHQCVGEARGKRGFLVLALAARAARPDARDVQRVRSSEQRGEWQPREEGRRGCVWPRLPEGSEEVGPYYVVGVGSGSDRKTGRLAHLRRRVHAVPLGRRASEDGSPTRE
eukprot:scaffold30212_cov35-Tisochrysis_lutea.AAC.1